MNMWQSEMKILKSKYHKQGYIVMNQKKYKIEILPVNEIWPSVPKAVKLSASVDCVLFAFVSNSFVTPLTESKSLCGEVELLSFIHTQSG